MQAHTDWQGPEFDELLARLGQAVRMPALQLFDFHVFLQLNDVYFLDARADYSRPDGYLLPRIATIVKRLKAELPGKVTVCVPGDFLAPSCLGKHSCGRHMVEVFNCIGVDLVAFGNHEFEQTPFTPSTLAKNIAQSKFTWLCANFKAKAPELKALFDAGKKVKPHQIVRLRKGLVAVLFGTTLPDDYRSYGCAAKPIDIAKTVMDDARNADRRLRKGIDTPVFMAMTHQDAADDRAFAQRHQDLLVVMGGHDHDEDYVIDEKRPMIVKAASNARTLRFNVLVHRPHKSWQPNLKVLWSDSRSLILNRVFGTKTQEAVDAAPKSVQDLIVPPSTPSRRITPVDAGFIDDTRLRSGISAFGDFDVGIYSFAIETFLPALIEHIPEDPETRACIDRWEKFWDDISGATRDPILVAPVDFDARDGHVRRQSTNLGNLAADALLAETSGADIGLLNSGSLRIDRELSAGEPITARTICDLLFFENTVEIYELSGRELWQILRKSFELRSAGGAEGHGDFLQIAGLKAVHTDTELVRLLIGDAERELVEDDATHLVATTDYVATFSTHYKSFFAGKTAKQRIGDYTILFTVAIRQLGVAASNERYAAMKAERWLSADAAIDT